MSEHVPPDLLSAFVDGSVDEQDAVHVAEHLDSCPACATQAASLEPLGPAFAAMDDPIPPDGLAEAVLEELARPEAGPTIEVAVGVGLLVLATSLAMISGDPLHLMTDTGVAVTGALAMGRGLATGLASFPTLMMAMTALTAVGAILSIGLPESSLSGLRRLS